jgi:hypothetical protein
LLIFLQNGGLIHAAPADQRAVTLHELCLLIYAWSYEKKGMAKGVVLPKSLTVKLIPQFAEMATPKSKIIYFTLPLN